MDEIDYSIHYARFHDDSEAHAKSMADWQRGIIEPYAPSDRAVPVLDIGCGFGFALRALRDLGFKNLLGVEQSAQQAERCRKVGFDVTVTDDTVKWLEANRGRFGFIVLLDVLEHIPVEFQISFLRAVRLALQPGGRLLLTVPNASSPLAARWRHIDYTHHSSFTDHSLHFVLKSAAFDQIDIDARKGLGRIPLSLWCGESRAEARRVIVRWCWLQVFKAEMPWEKIGQISFELNLKAVATRT